ncbi:hypothetical protein BDR04DRAFT_1032701 [Suillus decipiens]|nr:hypothetical protein BDR04DRAFT_1032701 [Suillus decipiens]
MQPQFSLTSLAAIYPHSFVEEFSNAEHQAAVHALLRHDIHIDGTHFHMGKHGGLHPSHITFNLYTLADEQSIAHEELVEVALQDIVMQDHLNGGISLLIHCPASEATTALSPEHIFLDLYIMPCKLHETLECLGGDVSVLVQAFGEEFAIPHLQHFMQHCHIEGIVPLCHCKSVFPCLSPIS